MTTVQTAIPPRWDERLPKGSWVYEFLEKVETVLAKWHQEFFSNYTIHGQDHIDAVLRLADKLMPNETLDQLDRDGSAAETLEVLTAAIALHDLGMFIQPDGLARLLFGEQSDPMPALDTSTWNQEWQVYRKRLQRYSDRELMDAFGSAEPLTVLPNELSSELKHRMVYGEFLRKHHPRLAHQIAVHGFPGATDTDLLGNRCDPYARNLVGLIARSHGMALRDTQAHLEGHCVPPFNPKTQCFGSIPVYYLMALLRLGDYMHAERDRAPELWLRLQDPRSPISQTEFEWNQAIYSHCIDLDLQEFRVDARPDDGHTFRKIKTWITDVQKELDTSWAVLMEKYHGACRLTVHRVDAPMLRPEAIRQYNKRFVTKEMTLKADADIVKLMVGPLYGDDPICGVRELIQNAVDACRERTVMESGFEGSVRIDLDTETGTLTVTDDGVGMTEEVIREYFLVAGSSYRWSPAWRENYTDEDGKFKVARTGHFGIGVMATFLLGDSATVTTRHMKDQTGYRFTLTREPGPIDVVRVSQCDVGTTVVVRLSKRTQTKLTKQKSWTSLYYASIPSVTYTQDHVSLDQPGFPHNSIAWHSLSPSPFSACRWLLLSAYSPRFDTTPLDVYLFSNGFLVSSPKQNYWLGLLGLSTNGHMNLSLGLPLRGLMIIDVLDGGGAIGTDLTRTRVTHLPDTTFLREDACRAVLAKFLTLPEPLARSGAVLIVGLPLARSRSGYAMASWAHLRRLHVSKVYVIPSTFDAQANDDLFIRLNTPKLPENLYYFLEVSRSYNFWEDKSELSRNFRLWYSPLLCDPKDVSHA
ncbi:MAG: ATP-binding protein, partial [Bifidobacteriaceae bacterium]|nr:ATP-binding protein [Bifidobacteriaceae bacterium]